MFFGMRAMLFLSLLFISAPSFADSKIPDFTVQVANDPGAKMQSWMLIFIPPPLHHFNTEAPMKVTGAEGQVSFIKVGATEERVGFRSSDPKLKKDSQITASIFLCDQAKTYCVKDTVKFQLKTNSEPFKFDFTTKKRPDSDPVPAKEKPTTTPMPKQKDLHGFWNNDLNSALAESFRTKKPILVDFYGIWCPPCNLFNETVFPQKKFHEAAKKWVLLKMDADAKTSFELKSHFKVGGYPTIIAMKAATEPSESVSSLSEINRVVGFYPLNEFLGLMDKAYAERAFSLHEKLASQKESYLQNLKQVIEIDLDKRDFAEAMKFSEEGEKLSGDTHYFSLTKLYIETKNNPDALKTSEAKEMLKAVWANRANEIPDTLMREVELFSSNPDQFKSEQMGWGKDILDQLASRVNAETLSVPGIELSIADIDSSRAELAEASKDPKQITEAYAQVVNSYQKLIQLHHAENSRGYNLELAYALWKSGHVDQAKALYEKFIALYPKEFTFYYAAAKLYLDQKDFEKASAYAEKAVQFSYGDNRIRSMERFVRVLSEKGEPKLAVEKGRTFLAETPKENSDLNVRTNHYLQSLQKAVDEAEKTKI
jgi:thioredoxin-like negative regulator of GroEL